MLEGVIGTRVLREGIIMKILSLFLAVIVSAAVACDSEPEADIVVGVEPHCGFTGPNGDVSFDYDKNSWNTTTNTYWELTVKTPQGTTYIVEGQSRLRPQVGQEWY